MHLSKGTMALFIAFMCVCCLDKRARTSEPGHIATGDHRPDTGGSDDVVITNDGEGEDLLPIERPACARVEPEDIRFDPVTVGLSGRHAASVSNCENVALTVREVHLEAPESFALENLPLSCLEPTRSCELNLPLGPNDQLQFTVRYTPRNAGTEGGRLVIELAPPSQTTLEISLLATGVQPDAPARPVAIARAGVANSGDYNEHGDLEHALIMQPGLMVELIGSDSFDPNGGELRYTWSVTDAPDNTHVEFVHNANDADPQVLIPREGTYTFTLTVENQLGVSATASVYIVARFEHGLAVDLRWEGTGALPDLDLHLLREPGRWNGQPEACFFGNPNPDWGEPGDANDPQLDRDCNGFGCASEMIAIADTELGVSYRIGVNYRFSAEATPEATIRVFINGGMELEMQHRLPDPDSFWEVARFTWHGGFEPLNIVHNQMPIR